MDNFQSIQSILSSSFGTPNFSSTFVSTLSGTGLLNPGLLPSGFGFPSADQIQAGQQTLAKLGLTPPPAPPGVSTLFTTFMDRQKFITLTMQNEELSFREKQLKEEVMQEIDNAKDDYFETHHYDLTQADLDNPDRKPAVLSDRGETPEEKRLRLTWELKLKQKLEWEAFQKKQAIMEPLLRRDPTDPNAPPISAADGAARQQELNAIDQELERQKILQTTPDELLPLLEQEGAKFSQLESEYPELQKYTAQVLSGTFN